MSKRSVTSVTFEISFRLPPGANVAYTKAFLYDAIGSKKSHTPSGVPLASLSMDSVNVKLAKRETVYL
jgi:hypothetical protein